MGSDSESFLTSLMMYSSSNLSILIRLMCIRLSVIVCSFLASTSFALTLLLTSCCCGWVCRGGIVEGGGIWALLFEFGLLLVIFWPTVLLRLDWLLFKAANELYDDESVRELVLCVFWFSLRTIGATKLKPRNRSRPLLLNGKHGESFGVRDVNSRSK